MQSEHNAHDAQFSYEAQYMGQLHTNMNGGGKESMGDQRRASHYTVIQNKVINETALTERFNRSEVSQNTSNSMSSSQVGKRF